MNYNAKYIILAQITMSKPTGKKKMKTDKRGIALNARSQAYCDSSPVYIPMGQNGRGKEYIRMQLDYKFAQKKAKQQILAFCLRYNYRTLQKATGLRHICSGSVH